MSVSMGAGVSGVELPKKNLTAIVAPTVNDDISKEYTVGSVWIDVTSDIPYVCVDNSLGAAIWVAVDGDVSAVTAGAGLTGGGASGVVNIDIGAGVGIIVNADDIAVDVGTTANKILQLDASAKIPAVDGSQLTGLPDVFTDATNTLVGIAAGSSITTAINTVAVGTNALSAITANNNQCAVGFNALTSLTTGVKNTAFGYNALATVTIANNNTAIGDNVLAIATGSNSTGVGALCLGSITSGANNVAVGFSTISVGGTASRNTAVGTSAGSSIISGGNDNSLFGSQAGTSITTGDSNTCIGKDAGAFITTANNNTCVGYQAGYSIDSVGGVYIGYQAGFNETGSNLLYIDNSSTTTPLIWGDFNLDYLGIFGKLGMGTKTPTAILDLKAGTATANTAPLKFHTGTLLTTPEDGAIEYNSGHVYFTTETTRYAISGSRAVVTSNVTVANTVTETTIYTNTLGANSLHLDQALRVRLLGQYSDTNDGYIVRIKLGGVTIHTANSTAANVTATGFEINSDITVRSVGATGTVITSSKLINNVNTIVNSSTATTTIDTTAALALTVTIQWNVAAAGDTLTLTQGYTEILH